MCDMQVSSATMGGHSSKHCSALGRSAPHSDGLANANDIALQSRLTVAAIFSGC